MEKLTYTDMPIIMHRNAMDLAFKLYFRSLNEYGYTMCTGKWLNLGYSNKPYFCTGMETIYISPEELGNWRELSLGDMNRMPVKEDESV
jgi:hypothetical protein